MTKKELLALDTAKVMGAVIRSHRGLSCGYPQFDTVHVRRAQKALFRLPCPVLVRLYDVLSSYKIEGVLDNLHQIDEEVIHG